MIYVIDAEYDGLNPTKIHCLVVKNIETKSVFETTDYDHMRTFFSKAKGIICHNVQRFDVPCFERLLGIKITSKLVDTLALSWYLYPNRPRHGLEGWGEEFGVPKPKVTDWENLSVEDYLHRCREDVEINFLLWEKMYKYLSELYGSDKKVWELIDYLSFKMYCAMLQEKSGWKVDLEYARESLREMEEEREKKVRELSEAMPKVLVIQVKSKPKRFINKDGSYSKLGMDWVALLTERGLPPTHEEDLNIVRGHEDPNPGSTEQVKDWLYSLGWRPQTFKHVKKDDGSTKAIPQINLEHGKGICPSIKALYDIEPRLEVLDGLSVLNHRIPLLHGIVRSVDSNGYTKAQISGFTNTLRVKHSTVVNLPKVEKPYGEVIRGSLIAEEGYVLCGSDLASVEDRLKQHYIYKYDPEYVNTMSAEDYDPHLNLAIMADMMTQEESDGYKGGDKTVKPIRDVAKNGTYSLQYLVGIPKLMITCGIDKQAATRLYNAYWKLNWSVKQLAKDQTTKTVQGQLWLKNPVSNFWYTLRFTKDIGSTLIQGTASWVFDMWLQKILNKRPQLTGQFHDEGIWSIKKGYEESCRELVQNSIEELNEELKLNRRLDISISFGERYSNIH